MICKTPEGLVGTQTDLGCIPNDPVAFVAKFYGIGLSLMGGVSLLFMIYGAFLILASQGSQEMIGRGKSYMSYAIGGLLLAVFGYLFIKIILGNILRIPGIG